MRTRSWGSAVLVGALAGCSLFSSLDGLTNPPDPPVDGGATTEPPDVVATSVDAGDGAASNVDAAPARGCASPALADASFCVDFEGADPLGPATWTSVGNVPYGTVALVDDASVSPPHAVFLEARDGGGCGDVTLQRRVVGDFARAKVHVAIQPTVEGIYTVLVVRASGADFSFLVRVFDVQAAVSIQKNAVDVPNGTARVDLPLPAAGKWHDVVLEVIAGTTPKARLVFDGAAVELAAPAELVSASNPLLEVGPFCGGTTKSVFADDVALFTE